MDKRYKGTMMLELDKIYNMDCLEGMKQIPDSYVDLVLTDPPYGVREDNWDVSEGELKRFTMQWMSEISRKTNKLLTFWSSKYLHILFDIAKDLFDSYRIMIWHKPLGSQYTPSSDFGMFYGFEPIILFYNFELKDNKVGKLIKELREIKNKSRANVDILVVGKKTGLCYRWEEGDCLPTKQQIKILKNIFECDEKLESLIEMERNKLMGSTNKTDVFSYRTVTSPLHPTQKNLDMIEELISLFSKKRDIVFDPFIGSGTTAIACKKLHRNYIGFEINKKYYDIANKRLKNIPVRLDKFQKEGEKQIIEIKN